MGTLLADADGIYDPSGYNDRLLLGLRGMLSEAELHLLQLRLEAGRMRQIERGTYRQSLPTGLVRMADGRVTKDPDQQIQRTIELVFARFTALGTCQKVLRSLRDDGLLLPRRQVAGLHAGQLLWKRPSAAALYDILRNPAYAGAFVYGRKGRNPDRRPEQARQVRRPCAAWTAVHRDAYPAYITWEQYLANQERLTDNASAFARRARGAPREGGALLAGLAVCGCCGRPMRVAYKAHHRYVCNALNETYRAPMCLSLDGASVDAAVVAAFWAALAPAELDLLDEVLAAQRVDHQRLAQQYADQVARAAYEAHLAERRYRAVDPDNRLVAAELERGWEATLRAVETARDAAERFAREPAPLALDPALRSQLADLGRELPALWASGRLTPAHQKELLRSLIRRVVLNRPTPDTVEARVVWVSGATSLHVVTPPLHCSRDLSDYDRLVARTLELAAAGYQDGAIAAQLSAEGFRSARSRSVPKQLVEKIRRDHAQISLTEQFRRQDKIDGRWTVGGLARELHVTGNWLRRQIAAGGLPAVRHPLTGRYLIADDSAMLARLKTLAGARQASEEVVSCHR